MRVHYHDWYFVYVDDGAVVVGGAGLETGQKQQQ